MGVSNVRDRRGIGPESGGGGQKGCSPRLGLLGSNATGALGCASLETVLESSGHILEVASAAGTDGLSSLSLLGPVVCKARSVLQFNSIGCLFDIEFVGQYLRCSRTLADLGSRVTARRALMLLDVKRAAT
jgi:hypothetical protein